MNRSISVLLAIAVVVGLLALVPLGVALAQETDESDADAGTDAAEEHDAEVLPGEQLSGVVGAGHAEHEGDVEARSFGHVVAAAETDEERADVIAERLQRNAERLDELEARHAELREQRDAGEITEGEYRARVAVAVAETERVNRTTNHAADEAAGLPDDVREERGIDVESIRALQDRTAALTGPEVAEIARGIVGDRPGAPFGPDDRPDRGDQQGTGADDGASDAYDDRTDADQTEEHRTAADQSDGELSDGELSDGEQNDDEQNDEDGTSGDESDYGGA